MKHFDLGGLVYPFDLLDHNTNNKNGHESQFSPEASGQELSLANMLILTLLYR